jgi:hypothetical protein
VCDPTGLLNDWCVSEDKFEGCLLRGAVDPGVLCVLYDW